MSFTYEDIINRKVSGTYSYDERAAILYALGIGFGSTPLHHDDLSFVYEKHLRTVPTMAGLFSVPSNLLAGVDFRMVVHAGQWLTLHQELPPKGNLFIESRVVEALDKGKEIGAIIFVETKTTLKDSGSPLSTAVSSIIARGDGGFGAPDQRPPYTHHALPSRDADRCLEIKTRPDQSIIYRLSGDLNPLHCDPEFAKMVGFTNPIMHGMCTYGICCRAIIEHLCLFDPAKIRQFDGRFSAPAYPGETLILDLWIDHEIISYRCRLKERDVTIIDNGKCVLST
jgi:acyl dehydratase